MRTQRDMSQLLVAVERLPLQQGLIGGLIIYGKRMFIFLAIVAANLITLGIAVAISLYLG